jgi:hypothetical protein
MLVLLIGEIMIELGSSGTMYKKGFMKIVVCVQAILKFRLRNMRGCNVGIIDGRGL